MVWIGKYRTLNLNLILNCRVLNYNLNFFKKIQIPLQINQVLESSWTKPNIGHAYIYGSIPRKNFSVPALEKFATNSVTVILKKFYS